MGFSVGAGGWAILAHSLQFSSHCNHAPTHTYMYIYMYIPMISINKYSRYALALPCMVMLHNVGDTDTTTI